ncbi:MAG: AMP-binding protein [Verrucomicrobiota bacterium]|nr:AMP-binding protein [Verrucomicrobiota bacterium]
MSKFSADSREALECIQLAEIQKLLTEILPTNKFYNKKLSHTEVNKTIQSLDKFREHCPLTTKSELVSDHQKNSPFGSNLTFPLERYSRAHKTSGTSGKPITWLDTSESWQWMVDNWCDIFNASGVNSKDRIFFAFSFGPFIGFWLAFEAGKKLETLNIPGGGLSSTARLQSIFTHQANVLCCTPTYALRLAEVARAEGIDLNNSPVRSIIVAGEPGGSIPSTRNALETAWPQSTIFDHHGMTEVGPVTYQCPDKAGLLHVLENAYLPEIIDTRTNKAVQANEAGELVLTTLGRHGSPLLRYQTGDLVKASESKRCTCGTFNLGLEGGILGRVDDMMVIRGVNVYPSAVEEIIRSVGGVSEYQVKVTHNNALAEIAIDIEPEVKGDKIISERLSNAFKESLSLRISIETVEPKSLPRFELKAQRWTKQ